MKLSFLTFVIVFLFFASCEEHTPNEDTETRIEEKNTVKPSFSTDSYDFAREVYIPIYSDIYDETKDSKILLTATLSIRNISKTDSLFINHVDYYNTKGNLVRSYIDQPIFLRPLETIDYVIDRDDRSGGSGANFLVEWKARKDIRPIFQGVMVGIYGQHGISFTTEGVRTSDE